MQWDEATAVQVKAELRFGADTRDMAGMRRWWDRWDVESQKELERRAAASPQTSKGRLVSSAWWTGVTEEDTGERVAECDEGADEEVGIGLSSLCMDVAVRS